jgi:hypothetical protein
MKSDETNPRPNKPKPRCEICNGSFGLIRHRFAQRQFCSNRCLDRYLAKRKQQPSSLKQWIDFSQSSSRHVTDAAIGATARVQAPITLSDGLTWTMKSEVTRCGDELDVDAGRPCRRNRLMIPTVIDNRLRRVWAILIGMSAVAVIVGMITITIHDRIQ